MTINQTIKGFVVSTEMGDVSIPETTVALRASKISYLGYDSALHRLVRFTLPLDAEGPPMTAPSTDLIWKLTTDATSVVASEDLRITKPIDGGTIEEGTLTGDSFAAGSIHGGKITDASISSAKLVTGGVTTPKLADYAVTAIKLATDSVTQAKVLDGAISTSKLADLGVTSGKLASSAVATAKVQDGAITWDKLDTAVKRIYAAQPNPKYVEGTTPQIVWSPYLLAGTASYVRASMGCLATGDTATLKLYRRSNGDLVTTLDVTGALATDQETAVSIPADGVYEFRGYCDNANGTAVFDGIEMEVRP